VDRQSRPSGPEPLLPPDRPACSAPTPPALQSPDRARGPGDRRPAGCGHCRKASLRTLRHDAAARAPVRAS